MGVLNVLENGKYTKVKGYFITAGLTYQFGNGIFRKKIKNQLMMQNKKMNIAFKTLQEISLVELSTAFNAAFQNYFVDIHFNPEQLAAKFKGDGVRPDLSVAAFHEDKIVGFIFHGTDERAENLMAYNGGTGVIPDYRAQQLTQRMYEFIFPVLKNEGVRKIRLEAITKNTKAINIYKNLGFSIIRSVDCYTGSFASKAGSEYVVRQKEINLEFVKQFWDSEPTWQNDIISVNRQQQSLICLIVEDNNTLLGYLVIHPQNGKIMQFAVHKKWRRKGIASALFQKAKEIREPFLILNVDSCDEVTATFLKNHGLIHALSQYEMEMNL